jgi:hypothetical protein
MRGFVPDDVWAAGRVASLPVRWQGQLLDAWGARHPGDRRGANTALRETTDKLTAVRIPLDAGDAQICEAAQALALRCAAAAERLHDANALRRWMSAICEGQGIEPPDACRVENGPAIARMTCHQWWRRKLRVHHGRAVEGAAIALARVAKGREIYCSTDTLQRRIQQNARNLASLENTTATNEHGQEYTLAELAAKGPANKAIRRAELMTRIAGFERIARDLGHEGLFMTVTCPSRMHRMRTVGAKHARRVVENSRWDGTEPREAQAYLSKVWARIRAKLHRQGVGVYGFRIAEPQHDGTPHWHFILFHELAHRGQVRGAVLEHALRDSPNEPGAHAHRVDFKRIDWERGSAAGYIAKYVAKNIDGYRLETDLHGNPSMETSARVEAWASAWGIRQFQQVGGPPVTVWRELRRIEQVPMGAPEHLIKAHEAVNKVQQFKGELQEVAARVAWDTYVNAQGGVFCGRDYRIKLMKQDQPGRLTRYGEQAGPRTVGVETVTFEEWIPQSIMDMHPMDRWDFKPLVRAVVWAVESKRYEWVIGGSARSKGLVSIGQATPAPWTRVNNCTEMEKNGNSGNAAPLGNVQRQLRGGAVHGAKPVETVGGANAGADVGTDSDGGWLEGAELQRWRMRNLCGPWPEMPAVCAKPIFSGGRTGAALAAWRAAVFCGPRLPTN